MYTPHSHTHTHTHVWRSVYHSKPQYTALYYSVFGIVNQLTKVSLSSSQVDSQLIAACNHRTIGLDITTVNHTILHYTPQYNSVDP